MIFIFKIFVEILEKIWQIEECWQGIKCNYIVEDVVCLCGSLFIEYIFVKYGVNKLW